MSELKSRCISSFLPIVYGDSFWNEERDCLEMKEVLFLDSFGDFEMFIEYPIIELDFTDIESGSIKLYFREPTGEIIYCEELCLSPGTYNTILVKNKK